MSATLTIAPPPIAYSQNPIIVEVTSDDYIAVHGIKSISRLVFTTAAPVGHETRLLWASGDVTLQAVSLPDDSGNQYPAGSGNMAHVTAVMAILKKNYYFDRDFDLSIFDTGAGIAIVFSAKQPGVIYNITPVADANVAVVAITAGVTEEKLPNIEHHLEVWLQKSAGDLKIYDNNIPLAPNSGVSTKDVSEVLHNWLSPKGSGGSDKPDLLSAAWQLCQNTIATYYLKFAKYYGTQPTVKQIDKSDPVIVNIGGLDIQSAAGQTLLNYLRPGGVNSNTLCLRQGSKVKLVQPDQPEFLYWLNLTGAVVDIRVRLDMFFTDGTSQGFYYAEQTVQAWEKYYVAVGYTQININAFLPSGKKCIRYTATVVSVASGDYLSVPYTYLIDKYRQWPRYFIYRNSLGGYQTLYTWGKRFPEVNRTKTDVKKQVTQSEAALSGSFLENNIRLQQKFTVFTGYRTLRDILLLNDLLASDEKYFIYRGQFIPVGISSDTMKMPEDGNNLNGAAIEFFPLYDDVVFTDDITLPDNAITAAGSTGADIGYDFIVDDDNNNDNNFYTDL